MNLYSPGAPLAPRPSYSPALRNRLLFVTVVGIYVAMYFATYRDLMAPVFEYFGLSYTPQAPQYLFTSIALAMAPSLWMPLRFDRPSQFFFYVQYFLVFIPGVFIPFQFTHPVVPAGDAVELVLAMFLGLSIMQATYLVPTLRIRTQRLNPNAFWAIFLSSLAVMVLYLVVTLGSNFRLADLGEIYNVRSAMIEAVKSTGSRFGLYSQMLLTGAGLPLIFATGFWTRRYWVMVPVSLGYIFLFGIAGAKTAVLSIALLPVAYLHFTRSRDRQPFYFVGALTVLLATGYLTDALFPKVIHLGYVALVHVRLITLPAALISQYFDFFRSHPVTHMGHVTGLTAFLGNPYGDIPYTLGYYYYHGIVGNNVGFWASDGLVGFGLWGIPALSFVAAGLFWVIDSVTADLDPAYVALALTDTAVVFQNGSLFTTMVSGGLALMLIVFLIAPRENGMIAYPRHVFRLLPSKRSVTV